MAKVKNNRYVFGYSEAEDGEMVVYAPTYEEANAKFEDGDYIVESEDDNPENWSDEDYDEYMSRCELESDYFNSPEAYE